MLGDKVMDKFKEMKNWRLSGPVFTLVSLMLLMVISGLLSPSFFTFENMITILRQASILFILSLGLTLVVLTGNIDFSVGALSALCGCICAKIMVAGLPAGLGLAVSLAVGIVFGLINGCLVGWLGLPSFVATYGMSMVASGLATMVMDGGVIYGLPESFISLGVGRIGFLPVPVLLALVLFISLWWVTKKMVFGRELYFMGLNKETARYSGINTIKTLIIAYTICGFFGAAGGILMTARLNAADAGMTEAYGLKIVAAVVVGGTSLLGGEGGVAGTVLGALTLTVITNIMNIMGVQTEWQNLVDGAIILLMTGFDLAMRRRLSHIQVKP